MLCLWFLVNAMTYNRAIRVIRHTREEWYRPNLSPSVKNDKIKMAALFSWAFDEIYLYLSRHSEEDPICALEDLLSIGETAASNAKAEDVNTMYLTLCDICMEMLAILKAMEGDDL